ncbi:MAG TPA: hypothetical protein VFD22_05335 [Gemmatimonadaceae bacterium]|nr:hypothetical protein [Gemmatimonadaceae bacterium]
MTTVPVEEASLDRGTCATEEFELVKVTTGIGDFVIEIRVAVAGVFEPAVIPYDATEKSESSELITTDATASAERLRGMEKRFFIDSFLD